MRDSLLSVDDPIVSLVVTVSSSPSIGFQSQGRSGTVPDFLIGEESKAITEKLHQPRIAKA